MLYMENTSQTEIKYAMKCSEGGNYSRTNVFSKWENAAGKNSSFNASLSDNFLVLLLGEATGRNANSLKLIMQTSYI